MSLTGQDKPRSLADVKPDEQFRIRAILFETLRDFCRDLGMEEGDAIVCRRTSPSVLVLLAGGRTILIERDLARFIEVTGEAPSVAAGGGEADVLGEGTMSA